MPGWRRTAPARGPTRRVSFDDLVGAGEGRLRAGGGGLRHGEAERLGGLEIDDQLEGGRLLHRQIGRLGAVEDLSGVNADLAIYADEARPIADQPAGRG